MEMNPLFIRSGINPRFKDHQPILFHYHISRIDIIPDQIGILASYAESKCLRPAPPLKLDALRQSRRGSSIE